MSFDNWTRAANQLGKLQSHRRALNASTGQHRHIGLSRARLSRHFQCHSSRECRTICSRVSASGKVASTGARSRQNSGRQWRDPFQIRTHPRILCYTYPLQSPTFSRHSSNIIGGDATMIGSASCPIYNHIDMDLYLDRLGPSSWGIVYRMIQHLVREYVYLFIYSPVCISIFGRERIVKNSNTPTNSSADDVQECKWPSSSSWDSFVVWWHG